MNNQVDLNIKKVWRLEQFIKEMTLYLFIFFELVNLFTWSMELSTVKANRRNTDKHFQIQQTTEN